MSEGKVDDVMNRFRDVVDRPYESLRLGIPAITIGGDSCDARFYSDAQVDTRLQALLETIEARRKVRQL